MKGLIAAIAGCLCCSLGTAAELLPPPANKEGVTYQKDIRPIFEKNCFKCHGPEKQKAKLRLDSHESASKNKFVKSGKSAESKLVLAVARVGKEEEHMPPKGKGEPLSKEQVALIRAWIDQGAK